MPLVSKKPSAAPANGEPAAAAPAAAAVVAAVGGGGGAAAPPPTAVLRMPDGTEILLPVLTDAAGARFLDVRRLQPTTGICTFDPGFGSTACEFSCVLGRPVGEAENILGTNRSTDRLLLITGHYPK
jgi:hypothetical protein